MTKNYLSYGGGVNSTAMLLLLLDEGWEYEASYVDHGCDWPDTRRFVYWLSRHTPIKILRPSVQGLTNLYDHCWAKKMVPSRVNRWCTDKFKVRPLINNYTEPGYELIGFSTDEAHRAKMSVRKQVESRYPLLEYEIDRNECIRIIQRHGIPVPQKSGCWFCPFQRISQWRRLRQKHPDLWCKAKRLEDRNVGDQIARGKAPIYLVGEKPLDRVVNENQGELFEEYKPHCRCEV